MEGKKDNNLVIFARSIGIMARLVVTREFWGIPRFFKLSQFDNFGDYLIYRSVERKERRKERQKVKSIFMK